LVFEQMTEALRRGDRIEIRGFGSFTSKSYDAYTGRNPRTGETIHVPAKRLPFFKVGKELKERVDYPPGSPRPSLKDRADGQDGAPGHDDAEEFEDDDEEDEDEESLALRERDDGSRPR
jgi:integration host factor subunit beta